MFPEKTHFYFYFPLFFCLMVIVPYAANSQNTRHSKPDTLTNTVLIHPIFEPDKGELIFSREHTYKPNLGLGDQLARDFVLVSSNEEGLIQFYEKEGKQNRDYISWRKDVLAPVSGTVKLVNRPDTTNIPGTMNRDAEPGRIYIKNGKGIIVSLVHVREINVEEGDQVRAGDKVAKVGNNGNSTGPHTHVGAWKEDIPYQIQVDLYAEKRSKMKY